MKLLSKRQWTVSALLSLTLVVSSCKTLDEVSKSLNESKLGTAGSGAAVGAGAFFACKLDSARSNTECAALAAAAGVLTYAYLKYQKNKMEKIDGVYTAACEAQNKNKEAYCVNMTEDAVTFSSGQSSLNNTAQQTLSQVAGVLNESDDTYIYIEGHTDPVGDESYNQRLSEQRAVAVKNYFQSKGIASDRLFAIGWGEEQPLPIESNAAQRRVELRIEGGESGEQVTLVW